MGQGEMTMMVVMMVSTMMLGPSNDEMMATDQECHDLPVNQPCHVVEVAIVEMEVKTILDGNIWHSSPEQTWNFWVLREIFEDEQPLVAEVLANMSSSLLCCTKDVFLIFNREVRINAFNESIN